jgi:hypothetical protein
MTGRVGRAEKPNNVIDLARLFRRRSQATKGPFKRLRYEKPYRAVRAVAEEMASD